MNQAPTLGKMRENKGVITPTLILPPQGGGDLRINPSLFRGGDVRKEKDGFPFPDQVEDRFHGNDREEKTGFFISV